MHNQNSEHEVNSIPGDGIMNTRHHFSRRVMLGGLVGLVGAGTAGCSLPFGPAQATPTPTALPGATRTPPSPLSPTPTQAPLGTTLYTYRGHSNRVNAVAWAPDGRRVASGRDRHNCSDLGCSERGKCRDPSRIR